MENAGETKQELAAALNRLRWIMTSLDMSGIRDWPVGPSSRQPAAAAPLKPEISVMAPSSSPPPPPSALFEPAPEPEVKVQVEVEVEAKPSPEIDLTPEPLPAAPGAERLLLDIREELGDCKRCRLHSGRKHLVFGDGSPRAPLVFVGEGPGFDEDQQGRPFVGRAGKLLDKMIIAMGFLREEVYICNVVKCRPPENRTPNLDEIEVCSPFLLQQLSAIHPWAICALGACAAQTLLGTSKPISQLRAKIHTWRGIPMVCTYHPAYLLRAPTQKAAVWRDLLLIHDLLRAEGRKGK